MVFYIPGISPLFLFAYQKVNIQRRLAAFHNVARYRHESIELILRLMLPFYLYVLLPPFYSKLREVPGLNPFWLSSRISTCIRSGGTCSPRSKKHTNNYLDFSAPNKPFVCLINSSILNSMSDRSPPLVLFNPRASQICSIEF